MYCHKCGSNIGQSNFCPNCGSSAYGNSYAAPGNPYAAPGNASAENFNLITAYKSMFKKYAQFNGRSRRSEYWLASLMNYIVVMASYLIIFILAVIAGVSGGSSSEAIAGVAVVCMLLLAVYSIVLLVPSLAMSVRRLHDTGRSGWFLLLSLVPIVGGIIVFVFSVLDSQPGVNQYGPNPKGF